MCLLQRTYTHEIGSLRTFESNWSFARREPEAGRGLERPERNGDRGRKTVELGLTALDGETSVKEVKPFLDSMAASITTPKSAEQNAAEWGQHARTKEDSSATHFVTILALCLVWGEDVIKVLALKLLRSPGEQNGLGLGGRTWGRDTGIEARGIGARNGRPRRGLAASAVLAALQPNRSSSSARQILAADRFQSSLTIQTAGGFVISDQHKFWGLSQ